VRVVGAPGPERDDAVRQRRVGRVDVHAPKLANRLRGRTDAPAAKPRPAGPCAPGPDFGSRLDGARPRPS
jgi:hypothetical protein